MPESYIEPLTNRQECFNCHKTVTGKKKLSKCAKCHAITYCGRECQVADWPRHNWNCVPVMVTEIPGKGRGLVAAKDIKKGELLFNERPSIEIYSNTREFSEKTRSVLTQLNRLPDGVKDQFFKLKVPNNKQGLFNGDNLIMQKFCSNARKTTVYGIDGQVTLFYLLLNSAQINHSCTPNVEVGLYIDPCNETVPSIRKIDFKTEVVAIKDISRGDEVTKCYLSCIDILLLNKQERMKKIQDTLGFKCKCPICSGSCRDQEDILRFLQEQTKNLNSRADQEFELTKIMDWEREAKNYQKMTELTIKLDIGPVMDIKMNLLTGFAAAAHLARNEELLKVAMHNQKKFVEDSKMNDIKLTNDRIEHDMSKWASERKLKKSPKSEEIESFLCYFIK